MNGWMDRWAPASKKLWHRRSCCCICCLLWKRMKERRKRKRRRQKRYVRLKLRVRISSYKSYVDLRVRTHVAANLWHVSWCIHKNETTEDTLLLCWMLNNTKWVAVYEYLLTTIDDSISIIDFNIVLYFPTPTMQFHAHQKERWLLSFWHKGENDKY